jgi:hypothetical protein
VLFHRLVRLLLAKPDKRHGINRYCHRLFWTMLCQQAEYKDSAPVSMNSPDMEWL